MGFSCFDVECCGNASNVSVSYTESVILPKPDDAGVGIILRGSCDGNLQVKCMLELLLALSCLAMLSECVPYASDFQSRSLRM